MRFPRRLRRPSSPPRTPPAPACGDCDEGLLHCHHVLVLHADGTAECEGYPGCGLDAGAHDHWVACTELDGCGCTGADHDQWDGLAAAA